MKFRKSRPKDKNWRAAEVALVAAQQLPGGPERAAALKRAGQLRLKIDERRLGKDHRERQRRAGRSSRNFTTTLPQAATYSKSSATVTAI